MKRGVFLLVLAALIFGRDAPPAREVASRDKMLRTVPGATCIGVLL